MDIHHLLKKGPTSAAADVHSECRRNSGVSETLLKLLKHLLNPTLQIDNFETIEWLKKLMAGEQTLEEFRKTVLSYDTSSTCGLVWTANFVAYRCRTCGISPCMSLCSNCFKLGDHSGHDFNMFRSQAGGACDCGDTNVMKESGFCPLHGNEMKTTGVKEPPDLLEVARVVVPRIIMRLILHMRWNSNSLTGFLGAIESAENFIQMLHDLSNMGAAMRAVMAECFSNKKTYKNLLEENQDDEFHTRARLNYEEAINSLANPVPPEEYRDIPSLSPLLTHSTFLEEFVFWTAKFEFPQRIVCLLLNLLPDADYKESFTRAFVLHYSRISQLLVTCTSPDLLSNRVVHVSVQLFSNETLALKMTDEMKLLHVMVISLKYMMSRILVNGTVDCGHLVMKDHCYWPLVSDLNNILSHRPVAMKFLEDDGLLKMWFEFLEMFQGMNVNTREMNQHIEFEPSTYYAAFSAELEASASPMWALASHLKDPATAHLTRNLLSHCRSQLRKWLATVDFDEPPATTVSFHLPLHRYYSVFLHTAVKYQGQSLQSLLPPTTELFPLIQHPLRVQTAFYEIISGLWVRNGLQIKGQAMTYVQCHFCNSMVDADLYLLQVAMVNLDSGLFLERVVEKFHCSTLLTLSGTPSPPPYLEPEQLDLMLENFAIFLTTLCSIRTTLGISETDLIKLEMTTLLCMGDKTHSQLMELIPERCGSSQSRDFERVLSEVADYHAPNFESSGQMLQGMYAPKPSLWDELYDPVYVLLRAVHRRDFQTSLDRFSDYTKSTQPPWPPFRIPQPPSPPYTDPRTVLNSRVLHGIVFTVLYRAVHNSVSDQLVSLAVFLLEMALSVLPDGGQVLTHLHTPQTGKKYDMNFTSWYGRDDLLSNLKTEIDNVIVCGDSMEVDCLEESTSALATITAGTGRGRPLAIMESGAEELQLVLAEEMPILPIHESIISLLLKLHSKYSNRPYRSSVIMTTRTGDGPFFISNLLNKITARSSACAEYINIQRMRIWPENMEASKPATKSLAEERRKKLLQDMKRKQDEWNEKYGEELEEVGGATEKYDCVICSQSMEQEVVGVVVLVQMTSAMEWGQRAVPLPTQPVQTIPARVKQPWTTGILATTCGHHIHGECLKGYLNALKSQQRQHNISIERGEYACPLCRQLANSFLPIGLPPPGMGEPPGDSTPTKISTRKAFDDLKMIAGSQDPNFTRNTLRLNLEIELILGEKAKTCVIPLMNVLQCGHPDMEDTWNGLVGGRIDQDPCDLLIDLALGVELGSDIAHYNGIMVRLNSLKPPPHFYSLSNLLMKHLYNFAPPSPSGLALLPSTFSGLSSGGGSAPSPSHSEGSAFPPTVGPSLLLLPPLYDTIFKHYHQAQCPFCKLTPKDPSICLICSQLVCMREPCCKSGNLFEATKHSLECGSGTCIFLSVNSSTIVVVRGKRACLWGSVYLDSFGEEDRELKRGKPLYLCKERYDLLEQQWAQHRFDHTARKWIFHRDTL